MTKCNTVNNFAKVVPFLPKEEGINEFVNKSLVMTFDFSYTDNHLTFDIWARLVSNSNAHSFINCTIDKEVLTDQDLTSVITSINDSWYWHNDKYKRVRDLNFIQKSIAKSTERKFRTSPDVIRLMSPYKDIKSDSLEFLFTTIDLQPMFNVQNPSIVLCESDAEILNTELLQFKKLIDETLAKCIN